MCIIIEFVFHKHSKVSWVSDIKVLDYNFITTGSSVLSDSILTNDELGKLKNHCKILQIFSQFSCLSFITKFLSFLSFHVFSVAFILHFDQITSWCIEFIDSSVDENLCWLEAQKHLPSFPYVCQRKGSKGINTLNSHYVFINQLFTTSIDHI